MLMQQVPQQYKFFGRQYSGPESGGQQPLPTAAIVHSFQSPYNAYKQVHVNQVRGGFPPKGPDNRLDLDESKFDGKRARKTIQRRTVDYSASVIEQMKGRIWKKSVSRCSPLQPDVLYYGKMTLPRMCLENPVNCVATRYVRTSTNKVRCPIFCSAWTPEGRRLVTGASSGEFTLWNGLTFNFETILQAHESAVRAMEWSNNDMWLLSGDNSGIIKYWQSNMNNVKMFQAHVDPIRGVSFSPTDNKFATCSDDGLVKIWDFYRCFEEKVLRGHGADVKSVDWHPTKGLLVSGSKDSQQPVKLWDPKSGTGLATIHGHKSTVMDLEWNENGNWLLTASRDHLIKVYDIRMMKEIQTFRGHKKEATAVNWHPIHESFFASAGSDGSMFFWMLGCEKDLGSVENAHEGMIWTIKWHPIGHIVCTGSNDHTSKFWTRNRPGDLMKDRHNMNTSMLGAEEDYEYSVPSFTDSMIASTSDLKLNQSADTSMLLQRELSQEHSVIPGLVAPSIPGLDPEDKKINYESSILQPFGGDPIREIPQSNMANYRHSGFRLPTKEELESGKLANAIFQMNDKTAASADNESEAAPILYEADENDQELDQEIRNEFLQHALGVESETAAPKNDGKGLLPTPDMAINIPNSNETVPSEETRPLRPATDDVQGKASGENEESVAEAKKEVGREGNRIKPLFDNFEELQEKYEWDKGPLPQDQRPKNIERERFDGRKGNVYQERRNSHSNLNPAWRQDKDDFTRDEVMDSGPRFRGAEQADDFHAGSKRPYFDGPPERGFKDTSMNNVRPLLPSRFPNEPQFQRTMPDGERQGNRGPRHMQQEGFGNGIPHHEHFHEDRFNDNQPNFPPNAPRHIRPRLP